MIQIEHLLLVADAFRAASGLESEKTLSYRIYGDNKRIANVRAGADISVRLFMAAMGWFDTNWPEGAKRPPELLLYVSSEAQPQGDAA
jgi:hypothetical protein